MPIPQTPSQITSTTTPEAAAAAAPASPRPRRGWRRAVAAVGLIAAISFVLLTMTALVALEARRHLEAGRGALERGRSELVTGNSVNAGAAFTKAHGALSDAVGSTEGGIASVVRAVPVLGRELDVVNGVAAAGVELADAGVELSTALGELPDGLASLAPSRGRIPLSTLESMTGILKRAERHAIAARDLVTATPSTLLFGPLADARFEVAHQIEDAATALHAGRLLLQGLPAFAGADRPSRYFLVAESPAELRGTGGIWGAWAILTVDGGRFSISAFDRIEILPEVGPWMVPPPNPDYRRNYDQYGGAGFWRDMNMTPDFPSAARAAIATYKIVRGESLDGVISADPFALRSLLNVTGPEPVPGLGIQVSADNVVDFMTNRAYIVYAGSSNDRKRILGSVAGAAFSKFFATEGSQKARLRAILSAVDHGHLKVYSIDGFFQAGLVTAGVDGGLHTPTGDDLLSVNVNSRSGSKIDFYAKRELSYDVTLGGEHQAVAKTEITIHNTAPTVGIPGYVIHPLVPGKLAGDQVSLVTSSCPGPCELAVAARDGRDVEMRVGSELGYPWYQYFTTIHGGTTSTLRLVTTRSQAWTGNSSGGDYALTYLHQTTIKPTQLSVAIHAPDGTKITWTSQPMRVEGNTATWNGVAKGNTRFEVRFTAPLPLRWWRNLIRPIT